MSRITVSLDATDLKRLEAVAGAKPGELAQLYFEYLLAGGKPLGPDWSDPSTEELMRLAEAGGSLRWLKDEPDTYSANDGEPYD